MKIGDKILVVTNLADPDAMREYTVSKIMKDTVQCNNDPECVFYTAFCWPVSVKDELKSILTTRAKLKVDFDNSVSLVYELKNAIARGEK